MLNKKLIMFSLDQPEKWWT